MKLALTALRASLLFTVFLSACGGSTLVDGPGAGGAGGSSSSTTTSATATSSTGGPSCADQPSEAYCISAFPDCVPIYDDTCCPTCTPGACVDSCTDNVYQGCEKAEVACQPEPAIECGFVPEWACAGGVPECGDANGLKSPCGKYTGCAELTCFGGFDCSTCVPLSVAACVEDCAGSGDNSNCSVDTVPHMGGDGCPDGTCIPKKACFGH